MPATGPPALLAPPPLSASYFVWYQIFSNFIWHHLCHIMTTKILRDMDLADRPAMFSLTACLAPAFCFLFRMVLFIVKRHRLISRRVLWMSFGSAYVWCCLIHTCQPLVLLHSLPLRPFPLLISYGIKYSLISSGIIYVISWQQKYYNVLLNCVPCACLLLLISYGVLYCQTSFLAPSWLSVTHMWHPTPLSHGHQCIVVNMCICPCKSVR